MSKAGHKKVEVEQYNAHNKRRQRSAFFTLSYLPAICPSCLKWKNILRGSLLLDQSSLTCEFGFKVQFSMTSTFFMFVQGFLKCSLPTLQRSIPLICGLIQSAGVEQKILSLVTKVKNGTGVFLAKTQKLLLRHCKWIQNYRLKLFLPVFFQRFQRRKRFVKALLENFVYVLF